MVFQPLNLWNTQTDNITGESCKVQDFSFSYQCHSANISWIFITGDQIARSYSIAVNSFELGEESIPGFHCYSCSIRLLWNHLIHTSAGDVPKPHCISKDKSAPAVSEPLKITNRLTSRIMIPTVDSNLLKLMLGSRNKIHPAYSITAGMLRLH